MFLVPPWWFCPRQSPWRGRPTSRWGRSPPSSCRPRAPEWRTPPACSITVYSQPAQGRIKDVNEILRKPIFADDVASPTSAFSILKLLLEYIKNRLLIIFLAPTMLVRKTSTDTWQLVVGSKGEGANVECRCNLRFSEYRGNHREISLPPDRAERACRYNSWPSASGSHSPNMLHCTPPPAARPPRSLCKSNIWVSVINCSDGKHNS